MVPVFKNVGENFITKNYRPVRLVWLVKSFNL